MHYHFSQCIIAFSMLSQQEPRKNISAIAETNSATEKTNSATEKTI